jgi:hypothetical protein
MRRHARFIMAIITMNILQAMNIGVDVNGDIGTIMRTTTIDSDCAR